MPLFAALKTPSGVRRKRRTAKWPEIPEETQARFKVCYATLSSDNPSKGVLMYFCA